MNAYKRGKRAPSVLGQMFGVTLLEVLIAVVILAIGFLGVAALQTQAVKATHSAAQKSEATMLAYLMLDAMRANRMRRWLGPIT